MRRGARVGGGGGGTFIPSNFANSGIAPAFFTAKRLAGVVGRDPQGLHVTTNRRLNREVDDLLPLR